jgi:thiamine biosynthesis protein ThiS
VTAETAASADATRAPAPGRNITDETITIELNGEARRVARTSVRALLDELRLPAERIAVELNRDLLPRDRYDRRLEAGDRLEIVTFVGGG